MYGVILAGGTGSRLSPLTVTSNKHLLPVYDKPMIYYPLSTLILSGVKDVYIVTNENSISAFQQLLGNGREFGLKISYVPQMEASGIPNAIYSLKNNVDPTESFLVILGDNILYGQGLGRRLSSSFNSLKATINVFNVPNPCDFGVLEMDIESKLYRVVEKPKFTTSRYAVTGLYHFPSSVFDHIPLLKQSKRGEFEVSDLLNIYFENDDMEIHYLDRGVAWFDGGTIQSLMQSAEFIRVTQDRTGKLIGSPHEASLAVGNLTMNELKNLINQKPKTSYWNNLI